MDCMDHPQQMEQPAHRYLMWGYVGSLGVLVVDFALCFYYDFFVPHLLWLWEPYYLFSMIGTWIVFFPSSVFVALGYWGLRIKYSKPVLAASALATAGYIPALWLVSFGLAVLPSSYQTSELYFISFNGLLIAVGVLVILGLLPIRKNCVRADLLMAVVAFRFLVVLLATVQYFILRIVDFAPWLATVLAVLWLVRDGIGVIGDIPLVLFFGSERRAVATQ